MYHVLAFLYSIFESVIFLAILWFAMFCIIPLGWWGLLIVIAVSALWPLISYLLAYLSYPLAKIVSEHNVEGISIFVFSLFGVLGGLFPWILLWITPSWSTAVFALGITMFDYQLFSGVITAIKLAKE